MTVTHTYTVYCGRLASNQRVRLPCRVERIDADSFLCGRTVTHPLCDFPPPLPPAKLKLEDRLAAAAREKLAQASKESKEKQLQAERKRKAALFLQTLRAPGLGEPEAKRAELDPVTPRQVGGTDRAQLSLIPG